MKAVNMVCFGNHLIPESKLGKIENDVVRQVKKSYKEFGLKRNEINLIRSAASNAIISMVQFANNIEKRRSKK